MKILTQYILLVFATFSFITNSEGQSTDLQKTVRYFNNLYGADNLLINGRIYMFPNYQAKGNPFFYGEKIKNCDISINQKIFKDNKALYNIENDNLIILKEINNNRLFIELNNNLIDSFIISVNPYFNTKQTAPLQYETTQIEKFFVKKKFIKTDSLGFCEVLYQNKITLLKKHKKEFQEKISEETPHGMYSKQKTDLYMKKDNKFISINKKREFFTIFNSYKKEIRHFMKKNNINYRKINDFKLIKLVRFCENF